MKKKFENAILWVFYKILHCRKILLNLIILAGIFIFVLVVKNHLFIPAIVLQY